MEKEIFSILYPFKTCDDIPQIGLANSQKKVFAWIPGNSTRKVIPNRAQLIGITGRTYKDVNVSQKEQKCLLHFVALDIDSKDNENLLEKLLPIVHACPECYVRTSNSGNGFHVFFVLDKPIELSHSEIQGTQKQIIEPYREKISQIVKIDKSDNRMLFVIGGKQAWLYVSGEFIRPEFKIIPKIEKKTYKNGNINVILYSEKAKNLLEILLEKKLIDRTGKNEIYVKEIYEALQGTHYEFKTKSPMSSAGWHTNGFIEVSHRAIKLYTNADNHVILNIPNLNSHREVL